MIKVFNCIECGICCKNIHVVDQLSDYHNGDGVCFNLDLLTNRCKIYDNRPDICNVNKSFNLYFKSVMTREEYDKKNLEGCKLLWT